MDALPVTASQVLARARCGAPRAGDAVRVRVRHGVDAALAKVAISTFSQVPSRRQRLIALCLTSGLLLLGARVVHCGMRPSLPPRHSAAHAAPESAFAALVETPTVPLRAPLALSGQPIEPRTQTKGRFVGHPSLRAELLLLEPAAAALFNGDLTIARKLLAAHRRRFRRPQLLQERIGLSVLADCIEDVAHATAVAVDFLRAYPSGVLNMRIRGACDLGDGT